VGLFTKASVKALRRDVDAFTSNCVARDPDIVSSLLTAPAGRQELADLFVAYEAAAADVGEEEALEAAVDAARSEIGARFAELRSGNPRDVQDLAERLLRTFLRMAQSDTSVLEHFRGAMPVAERDKDEASLQDFFGTLARQFVIARSGNPEGSRTIEDMSTARGAFREIYDRVVADRGHEVAQWAAVDHASTMAVLTAAIYGVSDPDEVAKESEELVRSFLVDTPNFPYSSKDDPD
jgi:hypothetical protein